MLSEKRREKNRDNLGSSLKSARVSEGYTQKALADSLDLEYYTMISQMELGYISIPATLWGPIADVLRMNKSEWVLRCLTEYSPEIYSALFGNKSRNETEMLLEMYSKGALDSILNKTGKDK